MDNIDVKMHFTTEYLHRVKNATFLKTSEKKVHFIFQVTEK